MIKEEELKKILDKLKSEFLKENVDPYEVCAKLYLSGHLVESENNLIQLSKNKTEKFIIMFDALKLQPKEIFKRLQQICIEMDLNMLYKLIQSDLETNFCHLNMTGEEFNSHQDTNVKPLYYNVAEPTKDFVGREEQLDTYLTKRDNCTHKTRAVVSFCQIGVELMELHRYMQRSLGKTQGEAKAVVIVEKCATITGLGGIGKTQLALKYVEQYHREYGNKILWINAESKWTLRDSFQRLAEYLEINTKNCKGLEKETAEIAKDVYAHFSKLQCLFVFDNADSTIPDDLFPSGPQYKIHILITSRYQMWGKIKTYQLNNLTLDEAIKFIKLVLKINDGHNEENCVKILAEMLDCFPLALNQATAYITETNVRVGRAGSSFTIADYIELYKVKQKALLEYKFFNDFGNRSSQTTYSTWLITVNKIQESENGLVGLAILNIISYLGSKNIDPKIFSPLGNKFEIGFAIEILEQYSMINLENDMLHIHPLIQEVTKLNLKQKNNEEETFTSASELINIRFQQLMSLKAYGQFRQLLEHMEMILQAVKACLQNNPSDRKRIGQTLIRNLLIFMFDGYFEISESRQTKLILEQLLDIETEQYGHEHSRVAITLTNLGCAYGDLGDHQKKKTLLERSLAIQEKHYGLDHFQVAITLTNLGCAYGDLGNHKKKKTLLERSLAIEEKHYGLDHVQVAITLANLGCAYGALGDHEKKKTLLERSLTIMEKHYGRDHFQVVITLTNLGCAYGDLGNHEIKKSLLERSLAIQEKHYGRDHYEVAIALTNLGCAYGALGDHEKMKTLLERSLAIMEKHYVNGHNNVLITLKNLSYTYHKLEEHANERDILERILVIQGKHYGIICDGCQAENFTGHRYKCLVCSNYDLCSTCFEKLEEMQNHKSMHEMMCIGNAK